MINEKEAKLIIRIRAYAVLRTSACNPYSLAKMKEVMD